MSVISAVRDFIADKCPYLDEFSNAFAHVAKVDVDRLEEDATNYMVESTPAEPIVKRYANGDTVRRLAFSFCSRVYYGEVENLDTSDFYEHFADWLEDCTRDGDFPELDSSKETRKIRAITNAYLYNTESGTAQYQIQCELIYFEKRRI